MLTNPFAPELQPIPLRTLSSDKKATDSIAEAVTTTVGRIWGDSLGKPAGYIPVSMCTQGPDAVLSKLTEIGVSFEPTACEGQYQTTYVGSEYNIVTKLVVIHGRPKHSRRRSYKVAQKGRITREYIAANLALTLPFKAGALYQPVVTDQHYFVFWNIFQKMHLNPITNEQEEYDFVRVALVLSDKISDDGYIIYSAAEWVLAEKPLGPTKRNIKIKKLIDRPEAVDTTIIPLEFTG